MNKHLVLVDLPVPITTPRLLLRPMQAGDGTAIHEAVLDGYEECVKQLCWPATPPTVDDVEYETRHDAARFITREQLRFQMKSGFNILLNRNHNLITSHERRHPWCVVARVPG